MNLTIIQALVLQQRITKLLKLRFPNLTVEEATELSGNIVLAVNEVISG